MFFWIGLMALVKKLKTEPSVMKRALALIGRSTESTNAFKLTVIDVRLHICIGAAALALAACGGDNPSTGEVEDSIQGAIEERFPDASFGPVQCVRSSKSEASCTVEQTLDGMTTTEGIEAKIDPETGAIRWQGGS
jgi:hypothetical protein